MTNENFINTVIVAGDCAATATQVLDNTPGSGYIGNGEVIVTSPDGTILDDTSAATAPEIQLHWKVGTSKYVSKVLNVKEVTGYKLLPYAAATQQVTTVVMPNSPANDFTYLLKFRLKGHCVSHMAGIPLQKTIAFTTDGAASQTKLVNGMVAAINLAFANDPLWRVVATNTGPNTTVTLTAQPLAFELGAFEYTLLDFSVEAVNFTATIATGTIPFVGNGVYEKVAEMEYFAAQHLGVQPLVTQFIPTKPVKLNADATQTYDTLVITWVRTQGAFSVDTRHAGTITLFLPSGADQVADLVATLDAFVGQADFVAVADDLTT